MVAHISETSNPFRQAPCSEHIRLRPRADVRHRLASSSHLRLVVDNGSQTHQIEGGLAAAQGSATPQNRIVEQLVELGEAVSGHGRTVLRRLGVSGGATATAAIVALAVAGLMVGVRASQGTPPANFSVADGSVAAASTASGGVAAGDLIVVAGTGDSLWSLAGEHAPNIDRRSAVATLVDANGGATIVVGQAIVIPSHLLQ